MIELAKKWFSEHPLGFVDIGARGGMHPLVEPIKSYVNILGFEADQEAAIAVGDSCLHVALSNQTGSATLYRCAAPTNDSLRPINQAFIDRYNMVKFAQIGSTEIQTETLDVVLQDFPGHGEFIKLDTQGTEYEILEGANETLLERTAAIYCEVEFAKIYREQRLFGDVERLLRQYDFSFLGFDNMSYRSRTPWKGRERLLHADALFIKDPLEQEMSQRQQQVAAMACMLCGYDDFAREIVDAFNL
jgi:FkbM family methyltransferase